MQLPLPNRASFPLIIVIASIASVVMAGCNEVNELAAEAEVIYDGAESGEQSDTTACDSDAEIKGDGTITDGEVRITVTDSDGTMAYDETFTDSFDIPAESLHGDSGDWTLSAERSGDDLLGDQFNGEYAVFLNC